MGNVATYSCNRGYVLVGPEMRTCEDVRAHTIGQFSLTEPSCGRKSVFVWEWFCTIGVTVANLLRVDNYRYILQKAMFK